MDEVLARVIDGGIIVYIDDIPVYSGNEEEHVNLVSEVLERLQKYNLAAELDKCTFYVQEVDFWVTYWTNKALTWKQRIVKEIREWPISGDVNEVQSFGGSAIFTAASSDTSQDRSMI